MNQDDLDAIITSAPEYRAGIEKQLIENNERDQSFEYQAIALAYPWKSLDHPDYGFRHTNESDIPFIYYGFFKKRMAELGYEYQETNHPNLRDRRFIFNRISN